MGVSKTSTLSKMGASIDTEEASDSEIVENVGLEGVRMDGLIARIGGDPGGLTSRSFPFLSPIRPALGDCSSASSGKESSLPRGDEGMMGVPTLSPEPVTIVGVSEELLCGLLRDICLIPVLIRMSEALWATTGVLKSMSLF
jgi:hypothetical protein